MQTTVLIDNWALTNNWL